MQQIASHSFEKLHIVFGVVNDKDLSKVLQLLPKEATYYFTKASIPRALNENELKLIAESTGLHGEAYTSVSEAYDTALRHAGKKDFIYIGGSTFVVAELELD